MKLKKTIYFFCIAIIALLIFADIYLVKISNPIKSAIKSGENYLLKKVEGDNYHLDCYGAGYSGCPLLHAGQVFSGYFIAAALEDHLSSRARNIMSKFIMDNRRDNVWAYAINAPIDADDTAYALQTMLILNKPAATKLAHESMPDFRADFYKEDMDAYTTFVTTISSQIELIPASKNNTGIHPEVNANIYNLFQKIGMDDVNYDLIRAAQAPQGYWFSYFYPSNYFSTYLNLKLLCGVGRLPEQVNQGVQFIVNTQNENGSWGRPGNAYDTALALNALLSCHYEDKNKLKRGVEYLLSKQQQTGNWEYTRPVWQYVYRDTPKVVWSAYDSQSVITTALVVAALKLSLRD